MKRNDRIFGIIGILTFSLGLSACLLPSSHPEIIQLPPPAVYNNQNNPKDQHGCTDHDWFFAREWENDRESEDYLKREFAPQRAEDEHELASLQGVNTTRAKIRRHILEENLATNYGVNNDADKEDWKTITPSCQAWLLESK